MTPRLGTGISKSFFYSLPNSTWLGFIKYSWPGRVWLVTSRLGTGKPLTFFTVFSAHVGIRHVAPLAFLAALRAFLAALMAFLAVLLPFLAVLLTFLAALMAFVAALVACLAALMAIPYVFLGAPFVPTPVSREGILNFFPLNKENPSGLTILFS